jgi:HEPN domain-containing protein
MVEKYSKALLCEAEVGFPKTHDLDALLKLLPASRHLAIGGPNNAFAKKINANVSFGVDRVASSF